MMTKEISIHSPRVGGDIIHRKQPNTKEFQSTPPAWGETCETNEDKLAAIISIHSPRVGGDA